MTCQYVSKKDLEVCLKRILDQHYRNCKRFNRVLSRVYDYLVLIHADQAVIRDVKRIRDQIVI